MNIEKFKSLAENNLIDSIIVKNNQSVIGGGWIRVIAAAVVAVVAGSATLNAPGTSPNVETGDCTCNTDGCK